MKEKIKQHKKYIILIIPLAIISMIIYSATNKAKAEITNIEPIAEEIVTSKEELKDNPKKIKVDIKGEIVNPGVYELNEGDRVSDVINKSGGLTEKADTTLINLSKNLKDEMVIVIYNKNEIEKLKEDLTTTKTVIEYIEKECTCPDTINDACITENKEKEIKEKNSEEKDIKNIDKTEQQSDKKISINTANMEELKTLPGIGESKAKAIIEYRKENGAFKETKDITNVNGIGESLFEKFKDYITI